MSRSSRREERRRVASRTTAARRHDARVSARGGMKRTTVASASAPTSSRHPDLREEIEEVHERIQTYGTDPAAG